VDGGIEYRILGPLEVIVGGVPRPIAGAKCRALLTLLALRAGQTVSRDRLIDDVWAGAAPASAGSTLQTYVSHLRKELEPERVPGQPPRLLVTSGPGYLLRTDPGDVDAWRFERLVSEGRRLLQDGGGGNVRAAEVLCQALALWRGPALADAPATPTTHAEIARLEELRLVAVEERVEADLADGRHAELVGELEALTATHPLRERLRGQHMLALYRSGRQAEALRAYQAARRALVDELGIEPGPALRRLEQAILDQDAQLEAVPPRPSPRSPVSRSGTARPAASSPFVGREPEQARLAAAWAEARAQRRQAVMVGGEPGIGKTRLAGQVGLQAEQDGALVLGGRCTEDLRVPYQPFAEALGQHISTLAPDQLAGALGADLRDLARLVPTLVNHLPQAAASARAEPEVERWRLFEAVLAVLATAARHTPVLLVIDDLHWAAEPTLLLLRHLLCSSEPMALMVVATYRDTEVSGPLADLLADLRREPGITRLTLTGLDPVEVTSLVVAADVRPRADVQADLAREVHAATAGNPFFVEEVLRHLAETGALRRGLVSFGLPDGVREVVARRLRRLSDRANAALAAAAVVGAEFDLELLENTGTGLGDDELLDALEEVVAAKVVLEVEDVPGRYRFIHALVRQTIYRGLTPAHRARLHRQVGQAIEAAHPDDLGEDLAALAHHFAAGARPGAVSKAVDFALRAGTYALDHLAQEDAVVHLQRGLDVLARYGPRDSARRADLFLALAEARYRLSDLSGTKAAALMAAEAARAAASAERLARAAAEFAHYATAGVLDTQVVALCEDALAALGDGNPGLRAQVLATLGGIRHVSGDDRGEELTVEALALARRADDRVSLARALFARCVTLQGTPRAGERLALADELVALSEASGDVFWLANARRMRAPTCLTLGHLGGFAADADALDRYGAELRSPLLLALAAEWRALRALLEGRFGEVEDLSEEVLRFAGQDTNFRNAYAAQRWCLHYERGELAEVLPVVAAAVERNPGLPGFRALLALTDVELGQLGDARRELDVLAADDFGAIPRDLIWTATLAALAEVAVAVGDDHHLEVLERLLRPFAGQLVVVASGIYCPGAADRFLGMLTARLGRHDDAEAHFVAALALETSVGAVPHVARTRYWRARALLDGGDPGNRDTAAHLLAATAATAEALDMRRLGEQSRH
jgi:DNA-binding SARP family transcriptional activator